ncbi:MAG: hypothetical protein IT200_00775 [Thermoleophilia bacterium]|nr:hypothetical protein [Thermoleophilia bacterium]
MNPRRLRRATRIVHLAAGALAGFAIYARPVVGASSARDLLAIAVVPALVASGFGMWQQARLRRLLGGRRRPA